MPQAIALLLERLHPMRTFHAPQIYLAAEDSFTVLHTSGIACIDLEMTDLPNWQFPLSVDRVEVIDENAFDMFSHLVPDGPLVVAQIDLVGGKKVFHRIEGSHVPQTSDMNMALNRMFHEGNCVMAVRPTGGVSLINAANILRMQFFPKSANHMGGLPANALQVRHLAHEAP
ncbi:MAG: hypothetical protein ACOYON_10190 [Fimbriimonas sp.]